MILLATFFPCVMFVYIIKYLKKDANCVLYSVFHVFVALQSPIEIISGTFAMASFIVWKQYTSWNILEHEAKLTTNLQAILHKSKIRKSIA
jgi:hypothetical protein